ncbi:hypothetical protein Pelo_13312 [Pelomyxa schiedti]|nr:hypothetical protein Pelo_13312 [Pelomyxa schiedti]
MSTQSSIYSFEKSGTSAGMPFQQPEWQYLDFCGYPAYFANKASGSASFFTTVRSNQVISNIHLINAPAVLRCEAELQDTVRGSPA